MIVSIPQRVQPWPRHTVEDTVETGNNTFPSLKGFNRGPDEVPADLKTWDIIEFPSLKGFNRGPDPSTRARRIP